MRTTEEIARELLAMCEDWMDADRYGRIEAMISHLGALSRIGGITLFELYMRHLPCAAWCRDLEGRYVWINDKLRDSFASGESWIGKTNFDIFPKEDAEKYAADDARVMLTGETVTVTHFSDHPDGERHEWACQFFPMLNSDGAVVLVGGIAFDRTEITKKLGAPGESK